MPIRILDAATVGRIAAGEVVERPSSVVKELIENSLDAGATSITVEVKGGGIDYLRVTDNGSGIEPGQVRLAFENHATSKLQRAEQLDDIRTLGFRGEALPSIAAVSKVEMTTRARGQDAGTKLTIEGGQNMQVKEAGCPQGTTIIMRDLFFNVPVRRAFLKKPNYEGGLVSDAVARMLLGNPNVSMRFISGGNTLFSSFGDGKLRHAVFSVYGRETAEKMIELDASEGGTRIYGLIGVGELAKASRSHQLFFINGRSVRCPLLSKALEQVCRSRVTIGMYPMCVLNLVIPSTGVDVNVHPNKLEVRFRDAEMMRTACENLLAKAFEGERVLEIEKLTSEKQRVERRSEVKEIPLAQTEHKPAEKLPADSKTASAGIDADKRAFPMPEIGQKPSMPSLEDISRTNYSLSFTPSIMPSPLNEDRTDLINKRMKNINIVREDNVVMDNNQPLKVHRAENALPEKGKEPRSVTELVYGYRRDMPEEQDNLPPVDMRQKPAEPLAEPAAPAQEAKQEIHQETMFDPETDRVPFRVVGVVFKTYILVEAGDSLLLIDQHAAHERLQYEKYMKRASSGTASQQLITPVIVRLSAKEMAVVLENLDNMEDAGYSVEIFGGQDIRITAIPFVLGKAALKPAIMDMVQSLTRIRTASIDARRAEIMQMACKSAVKAGDALSDSEIRALIEAMQETGAPPTCPHGRPVVKTLTRRDLEKMFKRIQ